MADTNGKKTTASKAKKTAATPKTVAVKKSVLTANTLPTAEALKDRFKAGSIPLQSDFADLIDMANSGARAAGQASGQSGPGKGMRISDSGQLELDVTAYGFGTEQEGFSPVKLNSTTDTFGIDLANGLVGSDSGLSVKSGNGIIVDKDGVSINPLTVLPKGIITMFSGTKAPDGWALCNGDEGTPDLRNRFIMGGDIADIGGSSSTVFSGGKQDKNCGFSTNAAGVTFQAATGGTQLTLAQIPNHQHFSGARHFDGKYASLGTTTTSISGTAINSSWTPNGNTLPRSTGIEGSGKTMGSSDAHTHSINLSGGSHSHAGNITVPYYILAFIMKL